MSVIIQILLVVLKILLSLIAHALTFFLAIQFAYTAIHVQDLRDFSKEIPLQSLLGFVTFIPLLFVSSLTPLLSFFKQIDGTSASSSSLYDTNSTSWVKYFRRSCLLVSCYFVALIVISPVDKTIQEALPNSLHTVVQNMPAPPSPISKIATKSTVFGMIAIAMLYYIIRMFTFSDHLNHLYTMVTSGIIGISVVLGVVALLFTAGMLLWTNPLVLGWTSFVCCVSLLFLPWWILPLHALPNPWTMVCESLMLPNSGMSFFGGSVLTAHFIEFFFQNEQGWTITDELGLSPIFRIPFVMLYLFCITQTFLPALSVAKEMKVV